MTEEQALAAPPAPVLTERRGNVLLITLNRPEVRNAVNAALAAGVAGALEELDADDSLSVGVLTGAGGFFCAGMDLGRVRQGRVALVRRSRLRRHRPARVAQAADRRDRGLRRRRRDGDRARLRSDRRGARAPRWASPRPSARSSPPAGRCCGCRGGCPTTWSWSWPSPATPLPAERFHELGLVNRLAEPGAAVESALELAGAAGQERPARADRLQADPAGAVRLVQCGDVGDAGRDLGPRVRLGGCQGGRSGVQGEARAGLEGSLTRAGRPALRFALKSARGAVALATRALAAAALGHDQLEPSPEGAHQRCPGVLRGYWEIG